MAGNAHGQFAACEQLLINGKDIRRGRHVLDAGDAVFSGVPHRRANGFSHLVLARIRNHLVDVTHRRVFQHPSRLAIRVAHNRPARRIGRFARNPGQLQRQRIGQAHVPVEPVDEDRVVGRDRVNQLPRGQRGRIPVFVIPVSVQHPAAFRQLRREVPDPVAKLFGRARVAQLHAGQSASTVEEMHVRIVETRRDAFALQVNHLRIRADPFANLLRRADGGDAIAQNSDGFRFGLFVIHRPDFSVDQNKVGGSLRQNER
ncbi:MAG: hypothetical protein JMDDDDMK_00827 [Acidobacteria bacterium]|nr:hypothetical protein [Acidobacteriota bacterium]